MSPFSRLYELRNATGLQKIQVVFARDDAFGTVPQATVSPIEMKLGVKVPNEVVHLEYLV